MRCVQNTLTTYNVAFVDSELYFFGAGQNRGEDQPFIGRDNVHQRKVAVLCQSNIGVFRKEDAEYVGGYDKTLSAGEDGHFFLKLLAGRIERGEAFDVVTFPQAYYLYRQHPQTVQNVSRKPFDMEGYTKKVVQDALPYFQKFYDGQTADEIAQAVLMRRNQLIELGTKRRDSFKRLEAGEGTLQDKLSRAWTKSKQELEMYSAHPDAREYAFQRLLSAAGLSQVDPKTLIHPDLETMCIDPEV